MSEAEEQADQLASQLWAVVKMDTVQDIHDWRIESGRIITAALQARERAIWEEAAKVADALRKTSVEKTAFNDGKTMTCVVLAGTYRKHAQEVGP